jgi:hypothetical protein
MQMAIRKNVGSEFEVGTQLIPNDFYSENSLTWANLSLVMAGVQACAWFEGHGTSGLRSAWGLDGSKSFEGVPSWFFEEENDARIINGSLIEDEAFGDSVSFPESTLGKAIIEALDRAGIVWEYRTRYILDHTQFFEVDDAKLEIETHWNSYFGMRHVQSISIRKSATGEETAFWQSQVLVASREFEHIDTFTNSIEGLYYLFEPDDLPEGWTVGNMPLKAHLPILATRLFYLAETQFPGTHLMSFPRLARYGQDFDAQDLPQPSIQFTRSEGAFGPLGTVDSFGDQAPQAMYSVFPMVVSMGWRISTVNPESLDQILKVIPEGLVRIHTILEDGYLNGRSKDAPFNFELVTGAAVRLDEGRESGTSALGLSEWIPASHVGVYLADTLAAAREQHGNNGRESATGGAYDGLGLYAVSCINTLVFSHLIAEGDFYMIERLLDAAVRLGVGDESERACSNWGIARYQNGDLEGAIQKFEETLSMNAKTSVLAEVYYYLAIIYEELGKTTEAKRYRELCDQAGGYEPSDFQVKSQGKLNKANTGLTKSNPGLGTKLSSNTPPESVNNFCSSCGNKYPDAYAKFCSSCGKSRI